MKHTGPATLTVAVAASILLFVGCGGGGGGSTGSSGSTGTTGTTGTTGNPVGPLACGTDVATPNYVLETDPGSEERNRILIWRNFPIRVYAPDRNLVEEQSFGEVRYAEIIDPAIRRWVTASARGGTGFTYTYVNSASEADVEIEFETRETRPGAGDTLGITTATFNNASGLLVKARVSVSKGWAGMTEAEYLVGLRGTLTHEIGHALFLAGHSEEPRDVMYFQRRSDTDPSLTQRDANSIITSYCGSYPNRSRELGRTPVADSTFTIE